jgi:ClpP class serine protease
MPFVKRARPTDTRRAFRAAAIPGEALCIDPAGGGMLRAALLGKQPSPQAFGFYYDIAAPLAFDAEAIDDGIAILCVQGPLEHHDHGLSWGPHNYEALAREVRAASECASVRGGVLKIDSPGGVAAGMGECHKAIRRIIAETGVPWYAFADEMACSAAYHLASACTEVWTTEAGHVGSVGVILCTIDESKALEKNGIAVRYVVTGARKADMHPGAPITDEVLDVAQAKVDKLGRQFFRAVARARGKAPGGAALADPKAVAALQAGVYVGSDAVRVGLADGVTSWGKFLALVKGAVDQRTA